MNASFPLRFALAALLGASAAHGSLDSILAPLPFAETKAPVAPVPTAPAPEALAPVATVESPKDEYVAPGITPTELQGALKGALEEKLRPSGELVLIPLRDLPDLSEYSQPFNVVLRSSPSRLTRGNLLLRFQVENETGILGEWSVPYRAHVYGKAWFPKTRLLTGEIATPSDFEARRVDLLVDPDAVPATLETLLRHEYAREILPGRPLEWNDLVERTLIRKGDVVEVSAVNGLLAITMRAVARQDGSAGELIILRNLDSSKEFTARVTGQNRAEAIF